jgi:hypothetical protein
MNRVISACCAAVLAACGGGDPADQIELAAFEHTASVPSIGTVQLEGCVVDAYLSPRMGTTVRGLSAEGRLIGDATSDPRGVFVLRVPGRQTVSVAVAQPNGDALVVWMGSTDVSVGACLQDRVD